MGSLKLSTSGLVYFDSQAVIYSVETHADYWSLLEPVWEAAEARGFRDCQQWASVVGDTGRALAEW